jgi:hypothetical protein
MKALIVVESMFGNTRVVAEKIAEGMVSRGVDVDVVDVNKVKDHVSEATSLVVVGGPTHAFGMSRPSRRLDAERRGAAGPTGRGIREWLDAVSGLRRGVIAAAFDTGVDRPLTGSAARKASRRLRRFGCTLLVPPMTFHVDAVPGPLSVGESERASQWGIRLAEELTRLGKLPQGV